MIIASAKILISTEECFFLLEKRKVILSIKEKLKNKFNLAVAEIDLQNSHREGVLGLAYISNEVKHADGVINKAIDFLEKYYPGRMIDYQIDIDVK